jgi:hypothetical protein
MPVSQAKIDSNRRNSARSCGPKSPQGRRRSSLNALKHGMTAEAVALPDEDAAEVARRFEALSRELNPASELGQMLVNRVAFLSVRLERCQRFDTAYLSKRVRHAEAEFVDARLVEVEVLALRMPHEPATSVRRLKASPEGIDWLLGRLAELKGDLLLEDRAGWTPNHRMRLEEVLGENPGGYRINRLMALSDAMQGYFGHLDRRDGEGLDDPARARWARDELATIIDEESARLAAARAALDPEAIGRDRLEAADRALFDPSPELVLARKYEAATERALYKALKELKAAEEAFEESGAEDTTPVDEDTCETAASFLHGPDPAPPPGPERPDEPAGSALEPSSEAGIGPPPHRFDVPGGSDPIPMTIGRAGPRPS